MSGKGEDLGLHERKKSKGAGERVTNYKNYNTKERENIGQTLVQRGEAHKRDRDSTNHRVVPTK